MSKTTTSPILWLPSAADGIQLTPNTTAWTDGAWVELTASAPSTVFPAFLTVLPNNGTTVAAVSAEIDIGVGAAASEVVVAKTRVRVMADQWAPTSTVPLGLIYSSIASGSRIALRVRHGATADTDVYRVALGYYTALGGASGWSPEAPTVAPVGSTFNTITSGAAWTFGSWVEVLSAAAVTVNSLITGIVATNISAPHEIQIGTGAASSETAILTLPYATTGGGGDGFNWVRFPRPICINAGTRVSLRTRSGSSTVSFNGTLWIVGNR